MGKKSRVDVLVISQLPPPFHGSTLMTKVFLQALDSLGYSWTLVDRRFSQSVDQVGLFSLRKVLSAFWLMCRLLVPLATREPRVVVFFATNRPFSFLIDWILSEILQLFRKKTIFYLHTIGYSELAIRSKTWHWLVSRLLSPASEVVVLDQSLTWDVDSFTDAKVVAIPNTLPERPPPALSVEPVHERHSVLFLSNLVKGKGYEDFVELAIRALDEGINADFILAGAATDAAAEFVQRRISESRHHARIKYVGKADPSEKWRLLNSARLFVFPSTYKYEAFPLAPIEAISSGVPVLSYRNGAVAPLLENYGAGIVVDKGDFEGLYEAFVSVYDDKSWIRSASESGLSMFNELFTFESYSSSWGTAIKSIV